MRAGEMDRQVVIQTPTETQDDYGGKTSTWATFATVWASKRPARAAEQMDAVNRVVAQADVVWRLHWLDDVTYKMRISESGTYHDIVSIAEIGRH